MAVLQEHIKRINEKLQQLLRQYNSLQRENKRLKEELDITKSSLKEKQEQATSLEQRLEVLKAGQNNLSEEEKKSLEKRINQYIKEIDKCINFMNE